MVMPPIDDYLEDGLWHWLYHIMKWCDMTELMSEFGRFLSLAQQRTIPHDIANDLLVRFTSGMDGLLGVAGMMKLRMWWHGILWIIPSNSLLSLSTSKMMFATFAHVESPSTLDETWRSSSPLPQTSSSVASKPNCWKYLCAPGWLVFLIFPGGELVWWLSFNPPEKWWSESQIGSSSQLLGKIHHVWNHQPVVDLWTPTI